MFGRQKLKDRIEQLEVQLAGCSVAALGGTSDAAIATKGMWGWSPAYQDVLVLRRKYASLLVLGNMASISLSTRYPGPLSTPVIAPREGLYIDGGV